VSTFRADQLKAAREAASLSQFNLATKLEVSQARVDEWEKGLAVPSGAVLADLADALAIDPTSLFEAAAQEGKYRTHSKVSTTSYKHAGEAEAEAQLARLRAEVLAAEDAHARSLAAYRASDPWNQDAEAERLRTAGERLAGLSAKLKAFEAPE
jgi:transcriptional regulator with XRE-family HTH domain